MEQLLLPHGITIVFTNDEEIGTVSDGYHTFNELYRHRCLLFLYAIRHDRSAWKTRLHADSSPSYPGWFLAGTNMLCQYDKTDNGTPCSAYSLLQDITYHIPDEYWELCRAQEVQKAPLWDGHTSLDVIDRLERCLKNGQA